MELDTKSISILNKLPNTVIFRCLLTINHERQKPLFCPKTLARQALELQVFRPESLHSELLLNRLFESIEKLELLLHKLLNEGELIMKWNRKIKNKGNLVNAV